MATTYNRRCSLCGQFVASADKEALLEEHRFEWDEAIVSEFLAANMHVCVDPDPHGARESARLIEAGILRPQLDWLIEGELERRQANTHRPAWAVFTTHLISLQEAVMSHIEQNRDEMALVVHNGDTRIVLCRSHRDHYYLIHPGAFGCGEWRIASDCEACQRRLATVSIQAGSPERTASRTDEQVRTELRARLHGQPIRMLVEGWEETDRLLAAEPSGSDRVALAEVRGALLDELDAHDSDAVDAWLEDRKSHPSPRAFFLR
jgi:hypothetical protein